MKADWHKAVLLTLGYIYSGAKADIKVWDPSVESDDDYSTSRVNPRVDGDKKTRLIQIQAIGGCSVEKKSTWGTSLNLFSLIISGAESVEWGGEVYSLKLGQSPHTATEIGNGEYPDPIFGDSGYMKRMRVLDNSRILKFPEWVSTYADEYNCYDVYYISNYM
ncbi:uncharacterized protein LOC116129759 [Pistacia vera]|uniref:uncharacterized protein LOC116129759 n=1 Tax=Pistacia vera TaxID=55513 RepID=UPI001263A5B8|nr:uncharacterized protein LOC116129759 [Pistacia vera]